MERLTGTIMVICAGILNGMFALPMKRTSKWAFENIWLVYSVIAMLVMNCLVVSLSIPHLGQVYSQSGWAPVSMALGFGLLWGLANVFFGQGVSLVGISLTFPICLGLSTSLGTLVPMLRTPRLFLTLPGELTSVGVAIILAGVVVYAFAGNLKARQGAADAAVASADGASANASTSSERPGRGVFLKGLTVVIISGLLDPCLNFAFNFGDPIRRSASAAGASPGSEADAIWAPVLLGSLIVNIAYCSMLLHRNNTWRNFRLKGIASYWFMASLMGIAWMLSITLYGRGALRMGPLGGSIGWAVFYSCIILGSSLCGVGTGEWKEGRGRPVRLMWFGLTLLLVAVCVLASANALQG